MITAIQKPKRKYGEGSIYQRKDGRWVAKYKSVNMLKPCVVYAKSESEAKRKLRELKKDAAKGLVQSTSRRFGDYADQWLYTFKLHSVEDSSFDKYESAYLTHIKPTFGKMQLVSIHSEQLQNCLLKRVRRFHTLLSKSFISFFPKFFLMLILRAISHGILCTMSRCRRKRPLNRNAKLLRWKATKCGQSNGLQK